MVHLTVVRDSVSRADPGTSRCGSAHPPRGALMPAQVHPADRPAGRRDVGGPPRLVVAGFGHRGLGIAADALDAGMHVTCVGPAPLRVRRLIDELAGDDAFAAGLRAGLEAGALHLLSTLPDASVVPLAVFAPDEGAEDTGEPGPMEFGAAALAAGIGDRTHVVLFGRGGLRSCHDVVTGTIGMLTGREAGRDYTLGYGIAPGFPGAPTVVSGEGRTAVHRTEELFRLLGRATTTVTPVAAAVFVAHLQRALVDLPPWCDGDCP